MSDDASVANLNGSGSEIKEDSQQSLLSMRKGLFGHSASLLNTSHENEEIQQTAETAETNCETGNTTDSITNNLKMEDENVHANQNGDNDSVPLSKELEDAISNEDEEESLNDADTTEQADTSQDIVSSEEDEGKILEENAAASQEFPETQDVPVEETNTPEGKSAVEEAELIEDISQYESTEDPEAQSESTETPEDQSETTEIPEAQAESTETSEVKSKNSAPVPEKENDDESVNGVEEVCVQKSISMDTSNIEEPTDADAESAPEEAEPTYAAETEKEIKRDSDNLNEEDQDMEDIREVKNESYNDHSSSGDSAEPLDSSEKVEEVPGSEVTSSDVVYDEENKGNDELQRNEDEEMEVEAAISTETEEKLENEEQNQDISEAPSNVNEEEDSEATETTEEPVEETPRRGRRSIAQPTPTSAKKTPARARRGAVEPTSNDIEENVEESVSITRRSSARGAKKEVDKEEAPTSAKKTPTRGRGRKTSENKDKEEAAKPVTPKTPTRGSKNKKEAEPIEEEEEVSAEEKEEEPEKEEVQVETPARRGRRSVVASTPKDTTPATPGRRSTRTPAQAKTPVTESKPKETPTTASKGRARRGAKEEKAASEEKESLEEEHEVEEEVPETPSRARRGKPAAKETATPKSTAKSSLKTPSKTPNKTSAKTPKSAKKTEDDDPYDIDDMIDNHPEPLKNIQMEVQSFGAVTFSKVGAGKYEKTEKAAQERVANLSEVSPSENKPEKRKSLMDLNKRNADFPSGSRSAPPKRSKRGESLESDVSSTPKRGRKSLAISSPQVPKTPSSVGRKRKEAVPDSATRSKKTKVDVPVLDEAAQVAADLPEDGPPGVAPGSRVFALYDKVYYPATVINRDGLGRFQVFFIEDAIVKDLPEASVIPIASLQPGKLANFDETDETIRAIITSMPSQNDWMNGEFTLEPEDEESEKKTFSKPWYKLILDMEDWKDYIRQKSAHATDVKMDNIESIEDRSRRRTAKTTPMSTPVVETKTQPRTPSRTPGRTPGRPGRKSTAKKQDTVEEMETEDVEQKNVAEKHEDVAASSSPKAPKRGQSKATPKSASKEPRRGRHAAAEPAKNEEEEDESKEEVQDDTDDAMDTGDSDAESDSPPPKNISLFFEKIFILTSANRVPAEGQLPFKKNEMKLRILERGGIVVDDLVSVPADADAYLISDMHYRTHKYLAALARAMPCVSHAWIHECVKKESLLPYDPYVLKGGLSILDNEVYDLPNVRDTLLKDMRVCVYSTNDPGKKTLSFCQIWDPIVATLGATAVTKDQAMEDGCDVMVTDSTCDSEIADHIRVNGGNVVSSEWLIQSIIMSERQPYEAHPRFQHDGAQ